MYPCKPQFDYIKVELKRVKIIKVCFRDDIERYSRCPRDTYPDIDDETNMLALKQNTQNT